MKKASRLLAALLSTVLVVSCTLIALAEPVSEDFLAESDISQAQLSEETAPPADNQEVSSEVIEEESSDNIQPTEAPTSPTPEPELEPIIPEETPEPTLEPTPNNSPEPTTEPSSAPASSEIPSLTPNPTANPPLRDILAEDTVQVQINWGDLSYEYDWGIWDTERLEYPDAGWKPKGIISSEGVAPGTIEVLNESSTEVKISFLYSQTENGLSNTQNPIDGVFTPSSLQLSAKGSGYDIGTVALNLIGKPSRTAASSTTVGNVTVKITSSP